MALIIDNQILGQEASSNLTYCYLFEPLKVTISDTDSTVENIFADLTLINSENGNVFSTEVKYFVSDISPNGIIEVNITEIIMQSFNFDFYNISQLSDIYLGDGWKTIISEYIYKLDFYTDKSATKFEVKKLPIIGGREFSKFSPTVSEANNLTEIPYSELLNKKLGGYRVINSTLKDISLVTDNNYKPIVTSDLVLENGSNKPCGGVIIWKSKLGGWLTWGMDIAIENKSHKYTNVIKVNDFSTTNIFGGQPFVPLNYSGVNYSKKISLKALSLSSSDIEVLSEINGCPVIYYQKTNSSKIELMKIDSISSPISTLPNGGNFSISLSSIITNSQKTK